jgi:tetratricopeptide (TPR) repeat protein
MQKRLAEARANYAANPNDANALIWLGRRLSYLGNFSEAIDVYAKGIAQFPNDARLYRHRGHRYITLRKFDLAIGDLTKAAKLIKGKPDEVEPDGQPNARNVPTSTLQFNIWYHLGLAYYLTEKNNQALESYRNCLKVSRNPDALVATSHWLYMTLRRLKREQEAAKVLLPIESDLDIIENNGYHRLLLMYKGLIKPEVLHEEAAKQGDNAGAHSMLYGIGNWYVQNGRLEEGEKIFRQIVASEQWTSFGYIAAETQLRVRRHAAFYKKSENHQRQLVEASTQPTQKLNKHCFSLSVGRMIHQLPLVFFVADERRYAYA